MSAPAYTVPVSTPVADGNAAPASTTVPASNAVPAPAAAQPAKKNFGVQPDTKIPRKCAACGHSGLPVVEQTNEPHLVQ